MVDQYRQRQTTVENLLSEKVASIPFNASRDLERMREKLGTANPSKPAVVDQDDLERILYEIRDEWCSDTGEWDGSKMHVPELAKRLAAKLNSPKKAPW